MTGRRQGDRILRLHLSRALVAGLFDAGHFDLARCTLSETFVDSAPSTGIAQDAVRLELQRTLTACMRHAANSTQHTRNMASLLTWACGAGHVEALTEDWLFLLHVAANTHRDLAVFLHVAAAHDRSFISHPGSAPPPHPSHTRRRSLILISRVQSAVLLTLRCSTSSSARMRNAPTRSGLSPFNDIVSLHSFGCV